MRRLKQGRKEDELTGRGLAAVRLSFGWRRMELGRMRNSGAWMNDYEWGVGALASQLPSATTWVLNL
jgi:hypothetical protein